MVIVTVEIDLAKNAFAVHGVDATGGSVLLRLSTAHATPSFGSRPSNLPDSSATS